MLRNAGRYFVSVEISAMDQEFIWFSEGTFGVWKQGFGGGRVSEPGGSLMAVEDLASLYVRLLGGKGWVYG